MIVQQDIALPRTHPGGINFCEIQLLEYAILPVFLSVQVLVTFLTDGGWWWYVDASTCNAHPLGPDQRTMTSQMVRQLKPPVASRQPSTPLLFSRFLCPDNKLLTWYSFNHLKDTTIRTATKAHSSDYTEQEKSGECQVSVMCLAADDSQQW